MKKQINLDQVRADLASLSADDFASKYPGMSSKSLKGLSVEELEQRISKAIMPIGGGGHHVAH